MAKPISQYANPKRWSNAVQGSIRNHRLQRLGKFLDGAWKEIGPVQITDGPAGVIADGMWPNPNHFLRLRLFVEARAAQGPCQLLGVLRRRRDKSAKRTLEHIGFREFIYIEDDAEFTVGDFLADADELLRSVSSHQDFLSLSLPEGLPAYVVYDTVLKLARDPRPEMSSLLWRQCLAEALRDIAIYRRELDGRQVSDVALSHPWKTEWGSLIWLALNRNITSYHLTGFVEAMRIRRFRRHADFRKPVEHLPAQAFDVLPEEARAELALIGASELERRASGASSDINTSYAFQPGDRITDRGHARMMLAGDRDRPVVAVFAHVWYDFPHTFAMSHFSDFRDWMEATLAHLRTLDTIVWLLKPHPTEDWYGGFRLVDMVGELPPHVRLLPTRTDNKTVLNAADCVVTVHGTVGLEATAWGLPVILADQSFFADWGFGKVATSRADYRRLLGAADRLEPPNMKQRDRARAAFALALAEPPADANALPMVCDSRGTVVYDQVTDRLRNPSALKAETERLSDYLAQHDTDSFAAFHLVELAKRRASARVAQSCEAVS